MSDLDSKVEAERKRQAEVQLKREIFNKQKEHLLRQIFKVADVDAIPKTVLQNAVFQMHLTNTQLMQQVGKLLEELYFENQKNRMFENVPEQVLASLEEKRQERLKCG